MPIDRHVDAELEFPVLCYIIAHITHFCIIQQCLSATLLQQWTDSYLVSQIAPFSFKYFSLFNTRNSLVCVCGCEGDELTHIVLGLAQPQKLETLNVESPGVSTHPPVHSI